MNKGETITLNIQLRNAGTSQVNGVDGVISTSDSYVSISDNTISWGDINAGVMDWGGYGQSSPEIRFTVLQTAPPGHTINFDLLLTDEEANTWSLDFDVIIVATGANIVYQSHAINNDDNSNGLVNPGETITLNIQVRIVFRLWAWRNISAALTVPIFRSCTAPVAVSYGSKADPV